MTGGKFRRLRELPVPLSPGSPTKLIAKLIAQAVMFESPSSRPRAHRALRFPCVGVYAVVGDAGGPLGVVCFVRHGGLPRTWRAEPERADFTPGLPAHWLTE